jgi:hypothetical protein
MPALLERRGEAAQVAGVVEHEFHSYLAELDEQSMRRSSTTPEALL